ncbi:vWA domain-containing protein [Rhodovulum sp. PH10]|uniref:vWA domain-containing protein n=1 Tax=Rhodovulum sp. PH10 TaxID=1187851 RepID=UPI00058F9FC1|nr:VWA domain-containing protein [Rhodovulum sp. PH10]
MPSDDGASPSRPDQTGRLAENIVHFARALRRAGLPVGPGAVLDAVEALRVAGMSSREDFYWTLHAVLVTRHEHSLVFRQAFEIFFRRRGYLEQFLSLMMPQAPGAPGAQKPASARVHDALFGDLKERLKREAREIEVLAKLTATDAELLQKKDFAQMSADEILAAKAAIRRMVLVLDETKTRRLVPAARGRTIDMRGTLRASLRTGGALIDLKALAPATRTPPLVALLDISGSMGEYTRLFLHFLHAVAATRTRVSSFLFGTRLSNVTRALRTKDPDEALAACSAAVPDFSGGTRIAPSLAAFNKVWARRVLGQGAVVLLITDGLEREADDRLAFEIDRLHRSCRRLVWLNPLLRFSEFQPKAHGIRTMLPHVDEFRPIHDLSSMADLVTALSAPLPAGRTRRPGRAA